MSRPETPEQARRRHWNGVYRDKGAEAVSWFRPRLETSLELIDRADLDPGRPVVDVGAGASTLADDLLARGFRDITLLDVSAAALEMTRHRIGDRPEVQLRVADATRWSPDADAYQLWHDRAVFHFLVHEADRRRYVERLRHGLAPDGRVVLATFGPEGPDRCSGLPTRRYAPETLAAELGPGFDLVESRSVEHTTPSGTAQQFTHALLARSPRRSDAG